jgi:tetratricopeptide (TPR) repeat protein
MKPLVVFFCGLLSVVSLYAQPVTTKSETSVQALFFDAVKERALGDFERATKLLETAIDLDSTQAGLYFELGKNYRLTKRYDQSERVFFKALDLRNDDEWILNELCLLYEDTAAYHKLLQTMQKLALKHPDYQEDLVSFYIEQGRYVDANRALQELEAKYATTPSRLEKRLLLDRLMNPEQSSITNNITNLIAVSDWDTALTVVSKCLTSSSQTKEAKAELIELITYNFIKAKPLELLDALDQSELFYELNVLLLKSEIHFELGQFQESLRLSEEGLALYPAQAMLYLRNGMALNRLERWEEASAILEMGLTFLIQGQASFVQFYDELIVTYTALNQQEMVDLYRSKKADLE